MILPSTGDKMLVDIHTIYHPSPKDILKSLVPMFGASVDLFVESCGQA